MSRIPLRSVHQHESKFDPWCWQQWCYMCPCSHLGKRCWPGCLQIFTYVRAFALVLAKVTSPLTGKSKQSLRRLVETEPSWGQSAIVPSVQIRLFCYDLSQVKYFTWFLFSASPQTAWFCLSHSPPLLQCASGAFLGLRMGMLIGQGAAIGRHCNSDCPLLFPSDKLSLYLCNRGGGGELGSPVVKATPQND